MCVCVCLRVCVCVNACVTLCVRARVRCRVSPEEAQAAVSQRRPIVSIKHRAAPVQWFWAQANLKQQKPTVL